MTDRFTPGEIFAITAPQEVDIETYRDGAPKRRIIWIVEVDGRAFVRSEYATGRWLGDVLADPRVAIAAHEEWFAGRVRSVADGYLIGRVSEEIARKYAVMPDSVASMTREEVLAHTLEFVEPDGTRWSASRVSTLSAPDEVLIETTRRSAGTRKRTIIWIVGVDGGVFVRSERAAAGRWYQDVVAGPAVSISARPVRFEGRVEQVADVKMIGRVSEAFISKYHLIPRSTRLMIREEILPFTFEFLPRKAPA